MRVIEVWKKTGTRDVKFYNTEIEEKYLIKKGYDAGKVNEEGKQWLASRGEVQSIAAGLITPLDNRE